MPAKLTIGFLGAGKMATALAQGFINAGLVTPRDILASDPAGAACEAFAKGTGAKTTAFNPDVVRFANVLILAVKPDQMLGSADRDPAQLTDKQLLISIAAGVPLARLEAAAGEGVRLIRVMPNTPALVGASATGYALGQWAQTQDGALAQRLFSSVGVAFAVKECLLDAVTGLSGSGPAYGYLIIEALSDGGVAAGLPREIATRLAAQTLLGSARMVLGNRSAPGNVEGHGDQPGRNHHRGNPRTGEGQASRHADERGAGGGGKGPEDGSILKP